MKKLLVVNNPNQWNLGIKDVEVISTKEYLTNRDLAERTNLRVFNFSRDYSYQSRGYYVSLLAEARGHKPIPDVKNILDLRAPTLVRVVSEDLDDLIQKSLRRIKSEDFDLRIYFGHNIAKQYSKISQDLHRLFQFPFLHARFSHNKKWILQSIKTIPFSEIPESHLSFVQEKAKEYFGRQRYHKARDEEWAYDLAILLNPKEKAAPSNKKAIAKFIQAAEDLDFSVTIIGPEDFNRIPEFDALFIRENTAVNHHTYRFARRAQSEGLAVIDAPDAILRCANKVYLTELLENHDVPIPKTMIIHKENEEEVIKELGLPCVVKLPDSSFSMGVKKAATPAELKKILEELLEDSELVIAQEYAYTDFDWRIGVLDGKLLYACKYFMAKGHWQIYNWHSKKTTDQEGDFECVPVNKVPEKVKQLALRSTALIGKGLFGVDIKEINGAPLVIEVNENPNIDAGVEDIILKDKLYQRIILALRNRIEEKLERK